MSHIEVVFEVIDSPLFSQEGPGFALSQSIVCRNLFFANVGSSWHRDDCGSCVTVSLEDRCR